MSKKITLTYFDAMGRAELIRWLLEEGGIKYTDRRIKNEDWPKVKAEESPYGSMPWLDVDGKIICETVAVATYAAQEAGLLGSNGLEASQCSMIAMMANDCLAKMGEAMFCKDEAKKKEMMDKFKTESVPKYLNFILKIKGGKDWIVGAKMSLADVALAWFIDRWEQEGRDNVRKAMPEIMKIYDKVVTSPKIKAWIAKRPKTSF